MAKKKLNSLATIAKIVAEVATSEKGQAIICGTYSDGEPRSVIDAMRDEYISPSDREWWEKQLRKKKKKKKKQTERMFHKVRWEPADKKSKKKKKKKKNRKNDDTFERIIRSM